MRLLEQELHRPTASLHLGRNTHLAVPGAWAFRRPWQRSANAQTRVTSRRRCVRCNMRIQPRKEAQRAEAFYTPRIRANRIEIGQHTTSDGRIPRDSRSSWEFRSGNHASPFDLPQFNNMLDSAPEFHVDAWERLRTTVLPISECAKSWRRPASWPFSFRGRQSGVPA